METCQEECRLMMEKKKKRIKKEQNTIKTVSRKDAIWKWQREKRNFVKRENILKEKEEYVPRKVERNKERRSKNNNRVEKRKKEKKKYTRRDDGTG